MKITINKGKKTALLFGGSGMVGGHCLHQLLDSPIYEKVISFGRKKLLVEDEKLEQHLIDFDQLDKYKKLIKGDDLFCCLGTTIKKAGSKSAFKKVDLEYPKRIAELAVENGVNQFILVSSVGADRNSSVFYSQVKGELEDEVMQMDFWATHVLQPSLLLGERKESRPLERVGVMISQRLDNFIGSFLGKYRPVKGEDVASAMLVVAQNLERGNHTYSSDQLVTLGNANQLSKS